MLLRTVAVRLLIASMAVPEAVHGACPLPSRIIWLERLHSAMDVLKALEKKHGRGPEVTIRSRHCVNIHICDLGRFALETFMRHCL